MKMIFLIVLTLIFTITAAYAEPVRTLKICDKSVAILPVSASGSVLDFPIEPEKVILGTKGSFSIEFVKHDLVISPATPSSHSNLFVYLFGRRFVFALKATPGGSTVFFIKDCAENIQRTKKNVR